MPCSRRTCSAIRSAVASGRGPAAADWAAEREEISDLTALMRYYLERELKTLEKEGVRLKLIGDYSAFGSDLVERLERAVARTAGQAVQVSGNYRDESLGTAEMAAK